MMVMLSVEPLSLASEIRFWLTSERLSAMEERDGDCEMQWQFLMNGWKVFLARSISKDGLLRLCRGRGPLKSRVVEFLMSKTA